MLSTCFTHESVRGRGYSFITLAEERPKPTTAKDMHLPGN